MRKLFLVAVISCFMGTAAAQVPGEVPFHLDVGIGAGTSMPIGTLSDRDNTGYHLGARIRLSGMMPLNVVGSGSYNRLPNKTGSEADVIWMAGAGLEYPIPSVMVKPYFAAEALYNSISNTASGSSSKARLGAGLGAGVSFSIPAVGDLDVSVKYQMLNIAGKEADEDAISQVSANLSLMFNVL